MIKIISWLCGAGLRNLFQIMLLIFLTGATGFLINLLNPNFFNFTTSVVGQHTWFFRFIRWVVILMYFMFWPYFIRWTARGRDITSQQVNWLAARFRILTWLILFEVLVCENIIGKCIQLLTGN